MRRASISTGRASSPAWTHSYLCGRMEVNLAYEGGGDGEPVLFIAGQGGVGRTWDLYQVPAFRAAGYRVIRSTTGVSARRRMPAASRSATMVADTAQLLERLEIAPVRVVAVSDGAHISHQELMLSAGC